MKVTLPVNIYFKIEFASFQLRFYKVLHSLDSQLYIKFSKSFSSKLNKLSEFSSAEEKMQEMSPFQFCWKQIFFKMKRSDNFLL